jgi:flagellar hook assembly protein FlgD
MVRLTLYDLTGRVVRSFTPYASRLTPYKVFWDGRDDQGKEVRSGVYFLRVVGGVKDITKKVIVVR